MNPNPLKEKVHSIIIDPGPDDQPSIDLNLLNNPSSQPKPTVEPTLPVLDPALQKFGWRPAVKQSLLFMAVQHTFRLATEAGTRADLGGPFLKDYFKSVRSLRGWDDGDPFLVNYVGHTMMGAVAGYIQIHNDPKGAKREFSFKKDYWLSRLKAMGWSAAFSTQFEIGPLSEASLGNVGIHPLKNGKSPMAYVDLVVTPTLGTGYLILEDVLDKYVVKKIENRTKNRVVRLLVRSFLNPSRGFANIMRSEWMWHRDDRPL